MTFKVTISKAAAKKAGLKSGTLLVKHRTMVGGKRLATRLTFSKKVRKALKRLKKGVQVRVTTTGAESSGKTTKLVRKAKLV